MSNDTEGVVRDLRDAVERADKGMLWHPTRQEAAVCASLPGGCPHDAEWMASLPWASA